jgi:hypothetical protein
MPVYAEWASFLRYGAPPLARPPPRQAIPDAVDAGSVSISGAWYHMTGGVTGSVACAVFGLFL